MKCLWEDYCCITFKYYDSMLMKYLNCNWKNQGNLILLVLYF